MSGLLIFAVLFVVAVIALALFFKKASKNQITDSLKSQELIPYTSIKNIEELTAEERRKEFELYVERWRKGDRYDLNKYFETYIELLPNIKKCKEEGMIIDTYALGHIMGMMASDVATDELGMQCVTEWSGFDNVFNEDKNYYLYFINRLNHNFFGKAMIPIMKLIEVKQVDIKNEKECIYDKDLFKIDSNKFEDKEKEEEKLYQKVKSKILSLGLSLEVLNTKPNNDAPIDLTGLDDKLGI